MNWIYLIFFLALSLATPNKGKQLQRGEQADVARAREEHLDTQGKTSGDAAGRRGRSRSNGHHFRQRSFSRHRGWRRHVPWWVRRRFPRFFV